jgi:hypothetical protein
MAQLGRPRLYPDKQTMWREIKRRNRQAQQTARKVYHRSLTTEWATPQAFYETLATEFHFTLDVAAQPGNAKCLRYFTPVENGLAQQWSGVCWMNPPYGPTIGAWMQKAYESAGEGAAVGDRPMLGAQWPHEGEALTVIRELYHNVPGACMDRAPVCSEACYDTHRTAAKKIARSRAPEPRPLCLKRIHASLAS